MNCKPGDLAIVVISQTGLNLGRVVRVLRLHDSETHDLDGIRLSPVRGPRWVLERPLQSRRMGFGIALYTFPDAHLRPIRPGDISDEEVRDLYAPKVPEAA